MIEISKYISDFPYTNYVKWQCQEFHIEIKLAQLEEHFSVSLWLFVSMFCQVILGSSLSFYDDF